MNMIAINVYWKVKKIIKMSEKLIWIVMSKSQVVKNLTRMIRIIKPKRLKNTHKKLISNQNKKLFKKKKTCNQKLNIWYQNQVSNDWSKHKYCFKSILKKEKRIMIKNQILVSIDVNNLQLVPSSNVKISF